MRGFRIDHHQSPREAVVVCHERPVSPKPGPETLLPEGGGLPEGGRMPASPRPTRGRSVDQVRAILSSPDVSLLLPPLRYSRMVTAEEDIGDCELTPYGWPGVNRALEQS